MAYRPLAIWLCIWWGSLLGTEAGRKRRDIFSPIYLVTDIGSPLPCHIGHAGVFSAPKGKRGPPPGPPPPMGVETMKKLSGLSKPNPIWRFLLA